MATYIDRTHRAKKIDGYWVPQWKKGFLRWVTYTLMKADTCCGHLEIYSPSIYDTIFETEASAISFLKKVIASKCSDKVYIGFDDPYPEGLRLW